VNNLKQAAIGLEGYSGDYAGYLPSTPHWFGGVQDWCSPMPSSSSCTVPVGSGAYAKYHYVTPVVADIRTYPTKDLKLSYSARTPSGATEIIALHRRYWYLHHSFRVVGLGGKRSDGAISITYPSGGFPAGRLNAGPLGLGTLLTSGYLADASVFYCGSSAGMPGDAYNPTDPNAAIAKGGACSLRDWKDAGGLDGNALSFGEWQRSQLSTEMLPLFSSYNYRDIALGIEYPWHRYLEFQNNSVTRLAGVNPNLYVNVGAPFFKTSRILGGRAIVGDTFSKGTDYDATGKLKDTTATEKNVGYGWLAHRDGYNVLYGDWSAKWFGDPQQRFIWSKESRGSFSYSNGVGAPGKIALNVYQVHGNAGTLLAPFDCSIGDARVANSAVGIWHQLDVANGVDVGVDE
jgi:hypothetical protein